MSTMSPGLSVAEQLDVMSIRRQNLLLLCRLVIRGLLESVMKAKTRMLNSDNKELQDFFIVVEKILKHGLRGPKNLLNFKSPDDVLWTSIQTLAKRSKDVEESVSCVQQLPYVHSNICRVRAWLRLAMMQKKLADYFLALVESRELLREFYEGSALLRHDTTGVVFAGSLIGLRVIDCNLCLKEEDLNKQCCEVDLTVYVKIPTVPLQDENGCDDITCNGTQATMDQADLKVILDQKNYLEEQNRMLSVRLQSMESRLAIYEQMKLHNSTTDEHGPSSQLAEVLSINSVNSDTHSTSSASGLALNDPNRMLQKMEEMETAMALMEKSMHEKQDTIVSLRQQIEDVKKINLDIYQKLRAAEESHRQKDKYISTLEVEHNNEMSERKQLQKRLEDLQIEMKNQNLLQQRIEKELSDKLLSSSKFEQENSELRNEVRTLEEKIAEEQEEIQQFRTKLQSLQSMERGYSELYESYEDALKKVHEYEMSLEEMGVHLEASKLKAEDLRESTVALADAQWELDKEAATCKQCEKAFNVARRKHHCRNCGGIFCNACSDNTMPLPSSAKPVRVCDACYAVLLKRFSVAAISSI